MGDTRLRELRLPFVGPVTVTIQPSARQRVERGQRVIEDAIRAGDVIYGVNTGFGKLADRRIPVEDIVELQRRLVASHMVGVGEPLTDDVVRTVILLKIFCLSQGHSGVRKETVDLLAGMLNNDLLPIIPSQGSVGASGDLAPLAHMVGAMTGVGQIRIAGEVFTAMDALHSVGLAPITLGPKEGVALINGTQVSTALALKGLFRAESVLNAALVAGALSMEAIAGRPSVFDSRIQEVRKQAGQIRAAAVLRKLVADSVILEEEFEGRRVQDPYSFRCQPQVMGAALDLLEHSAIVLEREANAVSDNPLVFSSDGVVISGGNFHAQPVAFSADIVAMALCEIGSLSERRTAVLMDESMSGLPAFLVEDAGLNSGFQMTQIASAALVAENRSRAFPGSVDSVPTAAGQEDHVSMATHTAARLSKMSMNAAYIVAIELMSAAQGVDLRNGGHVAPALVSAYEAVRSASAPLDQDRILAPDIEAVTEQVIAGAYNSIAGILFTGDSPSTEASDRDG
jgi:histidine ammonia-lyase